MNTLLIPTDFSPVADNALQYAIDMAKEYNFDITLYHVVQLSTIATAEAVYIDTFSELSKQAEIKLNEKANSISQQNPGINVHFKVDSGLFLDSLLSRNCTYRSSDGYVRHRLHHGQNNRKSCNQCNEYVASTHDYCAA